MRAILIRSARWPSQRPNPIRLRCASTQTPPPVRPYRSQTEDERAALRRPEPEPEAPPQSRTRQFLSRYLNPFHEPAPQPAKTTADATVQEPRDPERGVEAAQRVVRQGVLDPRYKADSRRWIAIIIGLSITIGLFPEVWRRTMKGEKRKEVPPPKRKTEGAQEREGKSKGEP